MYKNWPEICKLGDQDMFLMMAVALVDTESDAAKRLAKTFPECFSETEVRGPVPLSVLKEVAQRNAAKEGSDSHDNLYSWDALEKFNIPRMEFARSENAVEMWSAPLLPASIDPEAKVGDIVVWNGKKFVVAEDNDSCDWKQLSPAECIDIDH